MVMLPFSWARGRMQRSVLVAMEGLGKKGKKVIQASLLHKDDLVEVGNQTRHPQ